MTGKETFALHDTVTGARRALSFEAPGSWAQSMTVNGRGTHVINLSKTKYSPAQWRNSTAPWARSLCTLKNGVPEYAGLIRRRRWDEATETLTLETVTPDVILNDRYPFGVGSYLSDPDFQIVAASLRSAVERSIRYVTGGNPAWGPEWGIPFRFANLAEAGTITRTYEKEKWATAANIVKELREMLGGPDLALIPAYTGSSSLVWDVLTGNPRVAGQTLDLPLSTRRTRAQGLVVDEVGDDMLSGLFGRGNGLGDAKLLSRAGYFGGPPVGAPPMIVRDSARTMASEDHQGTLDSRTQQYLEDHTWAVKQYSFTLLVEDRAKQPSFDVTKLRLGTRLNSRYSGGKFYDPFTELLYVIALRHDSASPDAYTPEVQKL